VRAVADDNKRVSEATVTVQVQDINDNSPTFSQEVLSIENLTLLLRWPFKFKIPLAGSFKNLMKITE
jgi:hypothetical protein